jgi:hypothetical protein
MTISLNFFLFLPLSLSAPGWAQRVDVRWGVFARRAVRRIHSLPAALRPARERIGESTYPCSFSFS